ncbi:hypothetical protein Bca52824_058222 [Brassica carinata]|uniref:Uncharacterized protein n=1 Tax=Brassica carinata TaxID=52824 RepID=A0A8X7QTJ1_BRACI|nr:hypothetical protein Bca52824_058222 [Brassica carinata]
MESGNRYGGFHSNCTVSRGWIEEDKKARWGSEKIGVSGITRIHFGSGRERFTSWRKSSIPSIRIWISVIFKAISQIFRGGSKGGADQSIGRGKWLRFNSRISGGDAVLDKVIQEGSIEELENEFQNLTDEELEADRKEKENGVDVLEEEKQGDEAVEKDQNAEIW